MPVVGEAFRVTLVPELKAELAKFGREDIMIVVGGVIPPGDFDELATWTGSIVRHPDGTSTRVDGFTRSFQDTGLTKFIASGLTDLNGLPVIITENGVEDSQDTMRPGYLLEHLQQVWKAVGYNWMVKGYFHWSLVDNFEWERGWSQRFGLWELDVETLREIGVVAERIGALGSSKSL